MTNVPAVVRYKETLGNNPGIFFGINILEEAHRKARTSFKDSDGTFQGQRYFTCAPGAGVFVTLEQISPMADTNGISKDKPPVRRRSQTFSASTGGLSVLSNQDEVLRELKLKQDNAKRNKVSENNTGGDPQQGHKEEAKAARTVPQPHVNAPIPLASTAVPQSNKFAVVSRHKYGQLHIEAPPTVSHLDNSALPQHKEIAPVRQHRATISAPCPKSRDCFMVVSSTEQAISAAPPLAAVPSHVSQLDIVKVPQIMKEPGPAPSQQLVETFRVSPPQPGNFGVVSNAQQDLKLFQPSSATNLFDVTPGTLIKLGYVQATPQQAHHDKLGTCASDRDHKGHHVAYRENTSHESFKPNTLAVSSHARPLTSHTTCDPQSSGTKAYSSSCTKQVGASSKSQLKTADCADQRLGVGSLVEVLATDGTLKYGVIRWIGSLPIVQGERAGIELEEPMEGCTDGTFQATGQKFFDCPHGRGLFYPLDKLVPDRRYDENKKDQNENGHELTYSNEEKRSALHKKNYTTIEAALLCETKCEDEETPQVREAKHEKDEAIHQLCEMEREKDEAIRQVREVKREKDEAIRQLCEVKREKDEANHQVREVKREKDEAIRQVREVKREKDEAIHQVREAKREKDEAIRQVREMERERDEANHHVSEVQREKDEAFRQVGEAQCEKEEALCQLREKESMYHDKLHTLHKRNQEIKDENWQQAAMLEGNHRQLIAMQEQIQSKNQEKTAMQEENHQLKASLEVNHRQHMASQEQIQNKTREKAAIEEENRQLKASLVVSRRQFAALQEQNQCKARQITALQQQLDIQDQLRAPDTAGSWNVPRSEIQAIPHKKEIGRGAWGEVYSARFRGKYVAIKIAHKEIFHESTIDLTKREIMIMSRVQHPNLVRFIAAVWDEAVEAKLEAPIIVSELMDMNLRAAYNSKDLSISNSLISIFRDVAYALHYLHCQGIIHRDISAPNVLLKFSPDRSILAKVSDFGSANMAKQSKTVGAGAVLYSAPEMFASITSAQKQTSKVDVYSYGVLLVEVTSRKMPTQETHQEMLQVLRTQHPDIHKLIVQCTEHSPANRPTMADILNRLC